MFEFRARPSTPKSNEPANGPVTERKMTPEELERMNALKPYQRPSVYRDPKRKGGRVW